MKKFLFFAALSAQISCGGSGPGDSASTSVSQGYGNFVASYSYRDGNCDNGVNKMTISKPANSYILTVQDSGDSQTLRTGDIFTLTTYQGVADDGSTYLGVYSIDLRCEALILEDVNEGYSDIVTIEIRDGDLLVGCEDGSLAGFCYMSYQRRM